MDLPRFTCQLHPATGLRMDLGMAQGMGWSIHAHSLVPSLLKSILYIYSIYIPLSLTYVLQANMYFKPTRLQLNMYLKPTRLQFKR